MATFAFDELTVCQQGFIVGYEEMVCSFNNTMMLEFLQTHNLNNNDQDSLVMIFSDENNTIYDTQGWSFRVSERWDDVLLNISRYTNIQLTVN